MIFANGYTEELQRYVADNEPLFQSLAGSRVFVSGAAGLIGSYVIDLLITSNRLLNTGITAYAVDKNRALLEQRFPDAYADTVKRVIADVNADTFTALEADYVIHAASNTSPIDYATKPVDTIQTNVMGTDRLIQFALSVGVKRFLFCSSVEAYGANNGDVDKFTETYSGYVDCNTLRAGYPSAKRVSEALCNAYMAQYDTFDFVTARIGRIYGPTVIEGDAKAPSQFINNAVEGEPIVMKSDGMQQYSYGYVGDCAVALLFILLKGEKGQAYNVADPGSCVLLRDFAQAAATAGQTEITFVVPTAVETAGYSKITKATMDTTKLEALGWRAVYATQEGVGRTVAYMRELKGR